MSQFRKDVFTGRWVIVAETEVVRPGRFPLQEIHARDHVLSFLRDP